MQGTQVQSLIHCWGATEHVLHKYWAQMPRAHVPQQEKPLQTEACAPQLE